MKSVKKTIQNVIIALLLGTMLAACGGSSDSNSSSEDSVSVTGTAAVGAPFAGTISTIAPSGENVHDIAIEADGTFVFSVVAANFPMMIKAVPDGSGEALYSYITAADVNSDSDAENVNVTPLTSLALYIATGGADLSNLFDSWSSNRDSVTEAALVDAQAVINANFSPQFLANGIDPITYDFFSESFDADSTGIDAVLDLFEIDLNNGVNVAVDGVANFIFDEQIDTTGFNIGGEPVTYTVSGTVFGATGTVILQNNGGDDLTASNGEFTFAKGLPDGAPYNVTVLRESVGQDCEVVRGRGVITGASVYEVDVFCYIPLNPDLTSGSGMLNVAPTADYFDFGTNSNLATNVTSTGDIFGVANEGVNFGNEGATNIIGRRLYLLAASGSLSAVPAVPTWTDAAPWVAVSYDFTDGTLGLPISVGELWVVYTSNNNYAVMEITGVTGDGSTTGSFTFDYLLNNGGFRDFNW